MNTRGLETLTSGHVRFRFTHSGKKYSGTFATEEEAAAVRDEQGRWAKYIATCPFALRPLSTVVRGDILGWLDKLRVTQSGHRYRTNRPLSWQTRKHCLNLLRSFFSWARDRELVDRNPCLEVRVVREDGDEDEGYQDSWYLSAEDQTKLFSIVLDNDDEHERWSREKLIVAFAMGTGLRLGELACLHLSDVHLDVASPFIEVKYGSWDRKKERYRSPKGRRGEKKTRRVVLFGLALQAARAWQSTLPSYAPKNPFDLMFFTERGARRTQPPRSWKAAREKFGLIARIGRKPWWHLLRHTCASSLVAGSWGQRWSLEDVRSHLGHSSVKVTERYAHFADSVLEHVALQSEAAWQATGHDLATIGKNTEKMVVSGGLRSRMSQVRFLPGVPRENGSISRFGERSSGNCFVSSEIV